MKKSVLFMSLITVMFLSVLFTAPVAAFDKNSIEDVGDTKVEEFFVYLPLVIRDAGAPILFSPANGSVLNTLIPTFEWVEMEIKDGTMMQIEISKTEDFEIVNDYAVPMSPNTAEMFHNLEPATTYYWRAAIRDYLNDITYPYSETWSFTTGDNGVFPNPPTLISPSNGSTVTSLPTLQWNSVPGATGYGVRWKDVNGNMTFIDYSETPEHLMEWWDVFSGTTYEWSIRTKNNYAYGNYSETWIFTTAETLSDLNADINYEITESGPVFYFDGQDGFFRNN